MTVVDGPKTSAGLVQRVKNILMKPDAEWAVIEGEPATVQGLFTGYAAILAAIGPICGLIGRSFLTLGLLHLSLVTAAVWAVIYWILALVGVFVLGLIIDALATSFGGRKDQISAYKVAVYSSTAAWLAGAFQILPLLGILGILGLYSLYLLYRGLPKLMHSPEDKTLGYTIVVVVVAIVINLAVAMVAGSILTLGLLSTFAGYR